MTQFMTRPDTHFIRGFTLGRLGVALCLFLVGSALYGQAGGSRTWTDQQGRTVRAALVALSGDMVLLQLETGARSAVPVASLSTADQTYIQQLNLDTAPTARQVMPPTPAPMGPLEWPKEVITVDPKSIGVTSGMQNTPERRFHYLSGSFEFIAFAPLAGTVMTEVATDFELVRSAMIRLPWGWDSKPKEGVRFKIYLTETQEDYIGMGGDDKTSGYTNKAGQSFLKFTTIGLKKVGSRYAFDAREKEPGRVVGLTVRELIWQKRPLMYPWAALGLENLMQHLAYQSNGTIRFNNLETNLKKAVKERLTPEVALDIPRMLRRLKQGWNQSRGDSSQFLHEDHLDSMLLIYYFGFLEGNGNGAALHAYLREVGHAASTRNFRSSFEKGSQLMDELLAGRDDAVLAADMAEKFRAIGIKF